MKFYVLAGFALLLLLLSGCTQSGPLGKAAITSTCGNGICENDEVFATCPVDCHGSGNSCISSYQCGGSITCVDASTIENSNCCVAGSCSGAPCQFTCPADSVCGYNTYGEAFCDPNIEVAGSTQGNAE